MHGKRTPRAPAERRVRQRSLRLERAASGEVAAAWRLNRQEPLDKVLARVRVQVVDSPLGLRRGRAKLEAKRRVVE